MTRPLLALALSLASFAASLTASAVGREIATPPLGPTAYAAMQPATAFAGSRFLTVWREDMGDIGHYLKASFSDAGGRRVSPVSFTLLPQEFLAEWLQLVGAG